jgi:hypothetical protein
MKSLRGIARLVCLVLVVSFTATPSARADVISQWNEQVLALGGASRTLAMVQVAMFDAINAIQPRYRPYLELPAAPAGALPEAAAASAAYGVLVRLLPARVADLNATLASSLASLPDGAAKTSGVQYGEIVAYTMYQNRLNDNILVPGPIYISTGGPGVSQLTSPGPAQPINTNAPNWIPFALTSASQFRPDGPPALTSRRYADDLNETRALGELTSPYRTAIDDETARWHTELALFDLAHPAGQWVPSGQNLGHQHCNHLQRKKFQPRFVCEPPTVPVKRERTRAQRQVCVLLLHSAGRRSALRSRIRGRLLPPPGRADLVLRHAFRRLPGARLSGRGGHGKHVRAPRHPRGGVPSPPLPRGRARAESRAPVVRPLAERECITHPAWLRRGCPQVEGAACAAAPSSWRSSGIARVCRASIRRVRACEDT